MEIIAREWHLIRELAALDIKMITAEKIDLDRRNWLSELLVSAKTLVPTLYKTVDRKQPPAPRKFAPMNRRESKAAVAPQSYRRLSKPYQEWAKKCNKALEEHCRSVKGVKDLEDLEGRYGNGRTAKGWEIRSHLNLLSKQDEREYGHSLFHNLLEAMIEDEALQVLEEWLSTHSNDSVSDLIESGMKPLVAWQTLNHLYASYSSGIGMMFHKDIKYLLVFYRSECPPDLAYQIIDSLDDRAIRSVIILLDRSDLGAGKGAANSSIRKNAA